MLIRLLHGTGVAVLLGCLAWVLADQTSPAVERAARQLGERWYRLTLEDRHVGYLHTRTARDRAGRWQFDSDLRFVMTEGNPVRIEERLLFGATPPHPLLLATQRSDRPGVAQTIRIGRHNGSYRIDNLGPGDAPTGRAQALELSFQLGDYLGLEVWLRENQPPAGATVASRSLDFDRRRLVARQFRVVEQNATGYRLEHSAPYDATSIQLDGELRPVAMTLSGLFELTQTSREAALAPRTALHTASYSVPTDRPLPDHTDIRALSLEVEGGIQAAELWPELARHGLLRRDANAVSTTSLLGDELSETTDHPVRNPQIRALARQAVEGIRGPQGQVDALTRFVNGYLRYQDDGVRRHVLTLLDEPVGDCSEYAELLTTLARSLDIPTRTVFGLAYAGGEPPAFRFHAWNELLVEGEWRVVDPTWNQTRVDATHLPMPNNAAHALDLLTGGLDISFRVRDVEYF